MRKKLSAYARGGLIKQGLTPFARLLLEMGFTDVWRIHNPDAQVYLCQSASIGGLSRTDLGLGNELLLPMVISSHY